MLQIFRDILQGVSSVGAYLTRKNFARYQGSRKNLKQVPQNFMKTFKVDDVELTSHLMTLFKKINITSEKIINYSYFPK